MFILFAILGFIVVYIVIGFVISTVSMRIWDWHDLSIDDEGYVMSFYFWPLFLIIVPFVYIWLFNWKWMCGIREWQKEVTDKSRDDERKLKRIR